MVKAKSFDDGNSEMETRLQSDMGRQLSVKN